MFIGNLLAKCVPMICIFGFPDSLQSMEFQPYAEFLQDVQEHLKFLKEINEVSLELHQDHVIQNAIRRYETIWLPLVARNLHYTLVPPQDVAWVWHVHMLCPSAYTSDCKALVGNIPDHAFTGDQGLSQRLWSSTTTEPWSVMYNTISPYCSQISTKLKYDIIEASHRQKSFYYNVSLPHFTNPTFLQKALERYKKFVQLKRDNRHLFIVPLYDIDLLWHTHQLRPLHYTRDMNAILGFILYHDDSTTDRSPGSKLSEATAATQRLWTTAYPSEPYLANGTCYRGPDPKGTLYKMTKEEEEYVFDHAYQVNLISWYVTGLNGEYKVSGKVSSENHKSKNVGSRTGSNVVWEDLELFKVTVFPEDATIVTLKLQRIDGAWGIMGKTISKIYIEVNKTVWFYIKYAHAAIVLYAPSLWETTLQRKVVSLAGCIYKWSLTWLCCTLFCCAFIISCSY